MYNISRYLVAKSISIIEKKDKKVFSTKIQEDNERLA